jgi:DNA-binding winged helix-turn-helix (wHTH) protein/Tol biopolymer transport system component
MIGEVINGICFGDFELETDRRLLLKRGEPVNLNPKTFDLLLTLVKNHGAVLSKDDLLDRVWENQFVEENNLTVHVAALRKALGETKNEHRYIVTVPGKGYSFVAELHDPANGDIVVESHKFERIVVEEEIEEHTNGNGVPVTSGNVDRYRNGHSTGPIPAFPAAKPTLAGWIGQRRVAVALVIALLAALGGGFAIRDRLSAGFASSTPFVQHRVRQLTTNGKVGLAALSPDGKLFAYTVDDLGQKSLWLGYVDSGNHLRLRPAAEGTYRTLAFSPDSGQLYFSIRDEKNPKFTLYKMPVFGGVPTKVLDEIGNFSLSPDGKRIAMARTDGKNGNFIQVAALDGSERRDVASFPGERSLVPGTISWSPDGDRIAVSVLKDGRTYFNEIAVVEILTGEITRINLKNWREITKTAWLNDGSGVVVTAIEESSHSSVPQYRIVHVSYPGGETHEITTDTSNYGASWHNDAGVTLSLSADSGLLLAVEHRQLSNVWVAPADDLSAARQITFSSFGRYDGLWGMDWTPDGRLIYTSSDTKSQFISQMNADGSGQMPLTAPGMVDSVLTVSNDGRYIVFHSNRGGDFDIWRMDADGSNAKQLTFGGKGFQPAPSPDGHWVYYRSRLNDVGELCRVPIDGGTPECLNDKETSWGSFSPDGRFFAASYITDKHRLAIFSAGTHELIKQFDLPATGTLFMGSRWTADSRAVTYRDNSYGYWLQPIDGEAVRLEGLPKEKFYNFAWSKDGKWLAFVRGQELRDVVLFTNEK